MFTNEYLKPGIAAVVLAVLFPFYWYVIFNSGFNDFEAAMRNDILSLNWSDLLFVVIGALEVYLYLSLRTHFQDHLNFNILNACLFLMSFFVIAFHFTVFFDITFSIVKSSLSPETIDMMIGVCLALSIIALILYAIVGVIFSVILLAKEFSMTLKMFGMVLFLVCLAQLSIILAPLAILLFPMALIILAVYFLREPEAVEVV